MMNTGWRCLVIAMVVGVGCASSSDEGATSAGGSGQGGVPAGAEHIVVNEFFSTGADEWFELANGSGEAFDLSDWGVADTDKDTGLPKVSKAMRFPAGTTLPAGGHLLILTGKDDSEPGPYPVAQCLAGGEVTCFYATWGISASTGEAVHLIMPDDTVVSSTSYPTQVELESGSAASACRVPDLTGEFAACTATAGAANQAW